MQTISTKLNDNLCERLDILAEETERNRSYFVRKAIENFLEEKEDYLIALARVEKSEGTTSFEEVKRKYDLDN